MIPGRTCIIQTWLLDYVHNYVSVLNVVVTSIDNWRLSQLDMKTKASLSVPTTSY